MSSSRRQAGLKMYVGMQKDHFLSEDRNEISGVKELKWSLFRGILFCVLAHSFRYCYYTAYFPENNPCIQSRLSREILIEVEN